MSVGGDGCMLGGWVGRQPRRVPAGRSGLKDSSFGRRSGRRFRRSSVATFSHIQFLFKKQAFVDFQRGDEPAMRAHAEFIW